MFLMNFRCQTPPPLNAIWIVFSLCAARHVLCSKNEHVYLYCSKSTTSNQIKFHELTNASQWRLISNCTVWESAIKNKFNNKTPTITKTTIANKKRYLWSRSWTCCYRKELQQFPLQRKETRYHVLTSRDGAQPTPAEGQREQKEWKTK